MIIPAYKVYVELYHLITAFSNNDVFDDLTWIPTMFGSKVGWHTHRRALELFLVLHQGKAQYAGSRSWNLLLPKLSRMVYGQGYVRLGILYSQ